jgi:TatD DNase family protein
MLPLFDAHSHLPNTDGDPPDHPQVVCGTCESDWGAVLAHAGSDSRVIPMLGLHPWFVAEASPDWAARLDALLQGHPVGLGECGLDFSRKAADRPVQEAALRVQLRLAYDLQRPVALHVVQAWGRLFDLLREEGVPPAGVLVHAFSGSAETALALQAMGIYLSFSGAILDPERQKLLEVLRAVDSRQLLLETDGTSDLQAVVVQAAAALGLPAEDLAARTWENGQRFFKGRMA